MSNSRDPKFDGSYETSRYAGGTLEDDIMRVAESGTIIGEMPGGGLYRQTDSRIDAWEKGEPGNYTHHYYNSETGEHGTRSGNR